MGACGAVYYNLPNVTMTSKKMFASLLYGTKSGKTGVLMQDVYFAKANLFQ